MFALFKWLIDHRKILLDRKLIRIVNSAVFESVHFKVENFEIQ